MFAQVVVTDRGSSRIAFFERRVNYSHYILRCGIFVLLHFLVGIDSLGIQEPSVEKIKNGVMNFKSLEDVKSMVFTSSMPSSVPMFLSRKGGIGGCGVRGWVKNLTEGIR